MLIFFALLLILHFNDINKEIFRIGEIVKRIRIKSYSVEIKYTRLLKITTLIIY